MRRIDRKKLQALAKLEKSNDIHRRIRTLLREQGKNDDLSASVIRKAFNEKNIAAGTLKLIAAAFRVDESELLMPYNPPVNECEDDQTMHSKETRKANRGISKGEPICIRDAEVHDFLKKIEQIALAKHLAFVPPGWISGSLKSFLIPPRIVEEYVWEEAVEKFNNEKKRSDQEDREVCAELLLQDRCLGKGQFLSLRDIASIDKIAVLRGVPGEGKTSAVWNEVVTLAGLLRISLGLPETDIVGEPLLMPLAIPLGSLKTITPGETLPRKASSYMLEMVYGANSPPEAVSSFLEDKLRSKSFVLFLDALDELIALDEGEESQLQRETKGDPVCRSQWLREELLLLDNSVACILTARDSADLQSTVPHNRKLYRIACFQEDDVRQYVQSFFSHVAGGQRKSEQILSMIQLRQGPRNLSRIPLLLAILCSAVAEGLAESELPRRRTELLKIGLHGMFRAGDGKFRNVIRERRARNELKERLVRHVAWRFMQNTPITFNFNEFQEATFELLEELNAKHSTEQLPNTPEELLDELCQDGLFVRKGSGWGFILKSLQEYCVGSWIALDSKAVHAGKVRFQDVVRGGENEWARPDWSDFKPLESDDWKNVWPFVAGQLKDPDWLLELFPLDEEWIASDYEHVAVLFSEVKDASRLRQSKAIMSFAFEAVSSKNNSLWLKEVAAKVLTSIGDDRCVKAIVEMTKMSNDLPTRRIGITRLGDIHSIASKICLKEIFMDANRTEYESAYAGYGICDRANDADRLIFENTALSKTAAPRLRARAIYVLSQIASPNNCSVFLNCSTNRETPIDVLLESNWALRKFPSQESIDVLGLQLTSNSVPISARIVAAWSLRKMKTLEATRKLELALVEASLPNALQYSCRLDVSPDLKNLSSKKSNTCVIEEHENHFPMERLSSIKIGSCHAQSIPGLDLDMVLTTRAFVQGVSGMSGKNVTVPEISVVEWENDCKVQIPLDSLEGTTDLRGLDWLLRNNVYFCVCVESEDRDAGPKYAYFGIFWAKLEILLSEMHCRKLFNPQDYGGIVLARSSGKPSPAIREFMENKFSFQQNGGFRFELSRDEPVVEFR